MSRRPGPHKLKLELIVYALQTHPHGLWIREISRQTNLKKSTVSHYLQNHLADKIEVVHQSNHIKIVKLKTEEQVPNYLQ